MPESLTPLEIETLAAAFHRPQNAAQLLEDAGLPRGRQPGWEGLTAEEFWREVSALLAVGVLRDGRRRVLAAAAEIFPGNPVLAGIRASGGEGLSEPNAPAGDDDGWGGGVQHVEINDSYGVQIVAKGSSGRQENTFGAAD